MFSMIAILILIIFWIIFSQRAQREMIFSPITKWAHDNQFEVLEQKWDYFNRRNTAYDFEGRYFKVTIRDSKNRVRGAWVRASDWSGWVENVEWEDTSE